MKTRLRALVVSLTIVLFTVALGVVAAASAVSAYGYDPNTNPRSAVKCGQAVEAGPLDGDATARNDRDRVVSVASQGRFFAPQTTLVLRAQGVAAVAVTLFAGVHDRTGELPRKV